MDIKELKSHAYDCLANIEMWQKELQATNQAIAKATQAEPADKQPEVKEEVVEEK